MERVEKSNYNKIKETTSQLADITNQGLLTGIVIANADGSNLEEADYTALPATKDTDGRLYIVFADSQGAIKCLREMELMF